MNDLSRRIAGLSPAKLDILLKRAKAGSKARSETGPPETGAIPRRATTETAPPLSFAQQRLWFLDHLNPGNTAFNVPTPVRLRGSLNMIALEQSFNEICRRHESLRTAFRIADGQLVQEVRPFAGVRPIIADLAGLRDRLREREIREREICEREIREREICRLADEEQYRAFDLAEGPMLRVTLLKVEGDDHILLLTMHHIVSDGWSTGVMVREFASLYESYSRGKPSSLAELPIQYADFALWQRQSLQGAALAPQLDYWKRCLEGAPQVLSLPTDRPRPSVQSFSGARHIALLPKELSTAVQELGLEEKATLFMALLAGFQVMLSRYTGQRDILVGTDIANRNRTEIEPLIGFFINHVILRAEMSDNPTFRDLLRRVREVTLEAYAHQDLPFEKVVEVLQPERDPSRNPLFQVLFVLQNAPKTAVELPGLTLKLIEIENRSSKFDIALFIEETERGLLGVWNYNTDIFDASTIARMSGHFETLLLNIVADPDARVSTYEMVTEAEKMEQAAKKRQRKEAKLKMFFDVAPEAVSLPKERLIKTESLADGGPLPLVLRPAIEDFHLADWAATERAFIEGRLLKHGAILFRGFRIDSISKFEQFAQAACPGLFGEYGDLPREEMGGKVYGSTPYPEDKTILFHNESSHTHQWPMNIFFYCVKAAEQGGETPIVDCRKVYEKLDPSVRDRFERKRLTYVRNFTDGLDVSWEDFFRTTDRNVVEDFCRRNAIEFNWKENDGLQFRQQALAVAKHPKTGDRVFFNQIQLHHIWFLDPEVRRSLVSLFKQEDYPRNVYYGDGSPIEDDVMQHVMKVYEENAVRFPWQKGDVLMLDNMLTAHGRSPFVGSRKIVVAMGEMVSSKDVQQEIR